MNRGDVLEVIWPYSDLSGSKVRPAIVCRAILPPLLYPPIVPIPGVLVLAMSRCSSLSGEATMAPRLGWSVMLFTPSELEFLRSQRIARLATVGASGWPHVVPVMYALDDEGAFEFDVDGVKLRNLTREPRAAIVVDAMGPKRGVAVQGRAELIAPERARLTPVRKFSWGL